MPKGCNGTGKPYLRGAIWWIRYSVPGEAKRREESSKSSVRADAVRLLNQRRSEIDNRHVSSQNATISDLLDLFLADQKKRGNASYLSVKGTVENHLRPAFGKILCSQIESKHIASFTKQKQMQDCANASINRYYSALIKAFHLGEDNLPPLIAKYPKIEKLPEDNVRKGFLEPEQFIKLLNELPIHQRVLLAMGYYLGMRKGELLQLRWGQFDCKEGVIRLDADQTKTREGRVAPMTPQLRAYLEATYTGQPLTQTIIVWQGLSIKETKTSWNKACKRAGIPGFHIHDLRRTAVRNMVRSGIDQKTAMLISGHKTIEVFHRYNIVDERDLKAAALKLGIYMEMQSEQAEANIKAEAKKVLEAKGTLEGTASTALIQ